ncbi:DUF4263 domain-containing protein [Micromonospora sp. KC606]|uniref:Shedu anti-phage system protein SduA domain-containing protein n=1 Tax=Micromonospora sp. KC606 TaxID=2530379 RepID=UPI001045B495|nr:Shedu anti-phage system protein SduA domain-containing protein [Micromonospora sp. KC606]TDC84690.1 DUF4263 domain-containing protein [Micromonospora sp. KC606]
MAYWLMAVDHGSRAYEAPPRPIPGDWETSHCTGRDDHHVAEVAEGDAVALIRVGRHGGVVAHGHTTAVVADHTFNEGRFYLRCDPRRIAVRFDETYLSAPAPLRLLSGIAASAKARYARRAQSRPVPLLEISDEAWQTLMRAVETPGRLEWPVAWNLEPGAVVSRRDVHDTYGGQRQGAIVRCGTTPNTFVFLGAGSNGAPFTFRWADDGALTFVGKPEEITNTAPTAEPVSSENRLVLGHLRSGIPLRIFHSSGRKPVIYLGEAVVDQERPVEGWIDVATPPPIMTPRRRTWQPAHEQRRFRAPLLRVHPATELAPFLAPEEQPRRRRQTLRLAVTRSVNDAGPSTQPPAAQLSDAEAIQHATDRLRAVPDGAMPELAEAAELADLVIRRHRTAALGDLRRLIRDPDTREPAIQRLLEQHTWVFGGEYMGAAARRALSLSDQLDIPLIRGDGTLHGVEIKQANIPKLVVVHRGRPVVGAPVHEAVVQAMNYLRGLDEQRHALLNEYGVDCRRASMTVVIGDPAFVREQLTAEEIAEAIRTYNSHLSRIRVVTYSELLDGAHRSLRLGGASTPVPLRQ